MSDHISRTPLAAILGEDVFDGYGSRDSLLRSPAFRMDRDSDGTSTLFDPAFTGHVNAHLAEMPRDPVNTDG